MKKSLVRGTLCRQEALLTIYTVLHNARPRHYERTAVGTDVLGNKNFCREGEAPV